MKEVHIKVSNISQKQWVNLLVELNLVRSSWRKFGPEIKIKATNFDRIIKWGRRKPSENTGDIDLTVQRKRFTRKNRL